MSDEQSIQEELLNIRNEDMIAIHGIYEDMIAGDKVTPYDGRVYDSSGLKADVLLPDREQMRVKLLPATLLYSLEEYRSDQGVWFAAAGLFVGAALGVLINWVTGGAMTIASWVVIAVLLFAAGVFGYFYHQQSKRIERVKAQLFGGSPESE